MYSSVPSLTIPPGIRTFSLPGGQVFAQLSLPGGQGFEGTSRFVSKKPEATCKVGALALLLR